MKKVSVLFLVISIFLGCEKDDICSSDTGTTPQLILRFYDIANQEETKAVPNLLVYGINSFNEIVVLTVLDYWQPILTRLQFHYKQVITLRVLFFIEIWKMVILKQVI